MAKNTTTKTPVVTGSRLNGTDYIFTNLGGAYRVYPLTGEVAYAKDCIGVFRTWDEMWAAVNAL
jgi:hypothetical protein